MVEKVLLTGLGLIIMMIFLTTIIPGLNSFLLSYNAYLSKFEECNTFIDEIDYGVNFLILNSNSTYQNKVLYPKNMNFTLFEHVITYYYIIKNKKYNLEKKYPVQFYALKYENISPGWHNLSIYYTFNHIKIDIL
ncbi:MAG: hypothetical protein ACTSPH_00150 [Promethearchaeota archaeon]